MASAATAPAVDLKQSYDKVAAKLKELSALQGISGLLEWDQMVMMPPGSAASRGAQKEALAGVLYDKKTDAELGKLLKELAAEVANGNGEQLDAPAKAVVRDAHKDYIKATAIPKELAQRAAKLETEAYNAWVEARKASDFSLFAPLLKQLVELNKEKAKYIDPTKDAYDVLLDDFEKGMTSARLDEIFTEVRTGLVPLIAAIKAKSGAVSGECLKGKFDTELQAKLCKQIALDIGFDLDKGRLDVSVHPFTGGSHPTDVRMTTRFKEEDVTESITGAIHETGHALYEQGRNLEFDGLPVNSAMSMGVHESQSLLWERMVGLSKPFAHYLLPRLKEHFPEHFASITPEQLYAAENEVKFPSFIRVDSDEVTYPMHIILRYEIERGLISGEIQVEDVPSVWNAKMQEYLGEAPHSDAQGCLQDVHWSMGAFAYFPTYSLGAMYATQIYQKAASEIPDLEKNIAAGDFKALKAWLNQHIHRVGSLHPNGDDLMQAVTGSKLQPHIFLKYLKDKYTELYGL